MAQSPAGPSTTRERGKSSSASWRHWLMEHEPEKYKIEQEKQRERHRVRMDKKREHWNSGTRAAAEDKEAYMARRREITRRYRENKKRENTRQTRTSTSTVMSTPRVDRKSMTPDERRAHDNMKRREAYHAKSKQKKVADKKKAAAYMREYRLKKKLTSPVVKPVSGQTLPNATSTPLPQPQSRRNDTPPRRDRMRQHVYNMASKVKRSLKAAFTDDEVAAISCNLLLRRTPEKRKKNLKRLLENPVVRKELTPDGNNKTGPTRSFISKAKKLRRSRYALIKREIMKFYTKSDVSRVLPHKRYSTRHGPGYVMLVTIDFAHKAFCEETGKRVSLSFFASLRPPNVRKVGTVPPETCLCICCTNIKLKIDVLNRKLRTNVIPSEGSLMKFILCPYSGRWPRMECIDGSCTACNDHIRPFTLATREIFHDSISWMHWERRPKAGENGQTSLKLDVFPFGGTVYDLLTQLHSDLKEPVKGTTFIRHLFNAYWQQCQYNLCKDTLRQGQLLMVQDFAKNRTATYTKEVKSAYFGKQQVSLHPTVCYYKNRDGQVVRHIIMFFSDDIKHDAHHVHAVTKRAISIVQTHAPVKEVIVWSDGAGSQYKGRKTFGDLSLYEVPIERHFFGSEHGKGEADAETGRFSQAQKRACAGGHNFRNAEDMVAFAASCYKQDPLKVYSFVNILPEDIMRDRPECDVSTIPGTRGFHQFVRMRDYVLAVRAHSCFCSGCQSRDASCCINKVYVKPLEVIKLHPSVPQDEAFLEDQEQQEKEEELPFTSSDCPSVGQWIDLIGQVKGRKGSSKEMTFKAVVISRPEGGHKDHFYVQFLKKTPAGSYVITPGDTSYINPDMPEEYKWRVIPAPVMTSRNHYFF